VKIRVINLMIGLSLTVNLWRRRTLYKSDAPRPVYILKKKIVNRMKPSGSHFQMNM